MVSALKAPKAVPNTNPRKISRMVICACPARTSARAIAVVNTSSGAGRMKGATPNSQTTACHITSNPANTMTGRRKFIAHRRSRARRRRN